MWIDSHCHLDAAEFAADRDAVAQAAQAAGVSRIVVPAVAVGNFAAVADCRQRYPGVVAAFGIHPMYTGQAQESDLAVLRRWLAAEQPVAVGEIGLDGFVPGLDPARQEFFFVEQLKLAREFDLPVLLHIRRAQDAVLKQLRRIGVRGGIAHAFNGSRQQARQFIELGFRLGFGGTLTYTRATRIRELAATLPAESIVLETDAPDIPPAFAPAVGAGAARNSPEYLPRIAAMLAELRGLSPAELAAQTRANVVQVLPALG